MSRIRTVENPSNEVFADINDLLIQLLLMVNESSESERAVLLKVVHMLEALRAKGHKNK